MSVALLGVSVSLATVMYVLENFIPFPLPVGRWGFSNSMVLYYAAISFKGSLTVAAGKSILGSLFSGRLMSPTFIMGFLGSISAAAVERLLFKLGFGYLGMSLAGSAINNLVQVLVGAAIVKSGMVISILPIFLIFGSISAVANVYIAKSFERVKEVMS